MDYSESPVTKGYKKFFEIYKADIDRIPHFDQFVMALRESLIVCQVSALKGRAQPAEVGANASEIKEARTRLGMSIKELARRSGISVLTLRGLERGKVKPQAATLKKVQDALQAAARAK